MMHGQTNIGFSVFEIKSHNIGHFCCKVFMQTERRQAGERDGIPAVPDQARLR